MRYLTWLITLPLFAATLIFALQNRTIVDVSFWPLDAKATLPLSVLSIGLLVFGFISGIVVSSVLHIGSYFERRKLRKEVTNLNKKLAEQQDTKEAESTASSGPTILSQGRYQPANPPAEKTGKFPRLFNRR